MEMLLKLSIKTNSNLVAMWPTKFLSKLKPISTLLSADFLHLCPRVRLCQPHHDCASQGTKGYARVKHLLHRVEWFTISEWCIGYYKIMMENLDHFICDISYFFANEKVEIFYLISHVAIFVVT